MMDTATLSEQNGARSLEYALKDAQGLLLSAETLAVMLSEFGRIDLPAPQLARPMELRAVASLYLASTLEAAGLIQAADDLTRLVQSGAVRGDLGDAMKLVIDFWEARGERATEDERVALFGRLFGSPAGPVDGYGGLNLAFEERLLDLCDTIINAAEGRGNARLSISAERVAENIAGVTNDMVLMMARDIIASLGSAIAILNHPTVRASLSARTMWASVAAIDRRLGRPVRPTLSHLRRGRAGMVVLAWLADFLERPEIHGRAAVEANDPVVGASLDWVDETISIIESEERSGRSGPVAQPPRPRDLAGSWLDLGR